MPTIRTDRSRKLMWAIWLVALALFAVPKFTFADETPSDGIPAAAQQGVLLMRYGGIVSGKILKSGDNYQVFLGAGKQMFVPGTLVRFQCESLRAAYEQLREAAIEKSDANSHIALSRWCLTNQMLSEAKRELKDALALDPARDDARELLKKIDLTLDTPAKVAAEKAPAKPQPAREGFTPAQIESLGGLTREQAQHFSRRIQPMLVNNCAVSGCHTSDSETGFKLQRVVPGADSSRHGSERNLAEVLQQIDLKSPRKSPLVSIPPNHGRRGRNAFNGARGEEQLAELRKWVQDVARSERSKAKEKGSQAHEPRSSVVQAKATSRDTAAAEPSDRRSAPAKGKKDSAVVTADYTESAEATELPRGPDPFDPAEFNRQNSASGRRN